MNIKQYLIGISICTLGLAGSTAIAGVPSADLETDMHKLSGNLRAYPYAESEPPAQTPPPTGYEPFHLEHYGRHGSRWLIGENDYKTQSKILKRLNEQESSLHSATRHLMLCVQLSWLRADGLVNSLTRGLSNIKL